MAALDKPRMATSGALTIGVKCVPPMPPSEEMVKLAPCMSVGFSLPSRACSDRSVISLAICVTAFRSAFLITGTTRPFGVSAAKPMLSNCPRITISPFSSSEALKAGNLFSAATDALMTKASMVSLVASLFLALALLVSTRNAARSGTSASSNCVTCGIMTQLRCRFGPLISLMRDSGSSSVGPNLLKSTDGHGSTLMPPPDAPAGAAVGAAVAPLITPLTKFCTSTWVMRPFGPVPGTLPRSTPSSRANLRIDGEACASLPVTTEPADTGAAAAGAAAAAATGADATAAGAADAAAAGAAAATGAAAPPVAVTTSSGEPSCTLSPTLTLMAVTTPAWLDGISMLALSDSTVISDWSTLIVSPTLTISSMTSTSLKSPMSGTLTSTGPLAAAAAGAAAGAAAAGAGAGAAAAGAAAAGAAAGAAAPPSASSNSSKPPSATLSPTLILISLTTPAWLDGISMLALSDSTVINDWSTLIVSPTLIISSMTSTSLKSPISGTLTSTMLIAFAPYSSYWFTGFGLFASRPYLTTACSTTDASILPSSASDFSAATVM